VSDAAINGCLEIVKDLWSALNAKALIGINQEKIGVRYDI